MNGMYSRVYVCETIFREKERVYIMSYCYTVRRSLGGCYQMQCRVEAQNAHAVPCDGYVTWTERPPHPLAQLSRLP